MQQALVLGVYIYILNILIAPNTKNIKVNLIKIYYKKYLRLTPCKFFFSNATSASTRLLCC